MARGSRRTAVRRARSRGPARRGRMPSAWATLALAGTVAAEMIARAGLSAPGASAR